MLETYSLLFHIPEQGEELHDVAVQISDIFFNSLSTVSSFGFQLRVNINVRLNRSRGPITAGSPLLTLESEVSRKEYARLFTRLVFFAWNYHQLHPDAIDHHTVHCMELAISTCTKSNVFGFVRALLEEYTLTNSESSATIPLFVKHSCQLPNGSLMGLDNVSRMCARLIYLAKVSVLEVVMEREERQRMAAMEELKPLVELDNYNIFSFLCKVQGRARRVFCTSNRIPMILSSIDENDPWKIVVGGVSIHAEHLQNCYQLALSKCQALMDKLLMGVPPLSLSTVFDNFTTFSIMSHRDPVVDKATRCSLLKHVLETPLLTERFVLGVQADIVQYVAKECQVYLDLFDEYINHMTLVIHLGSGMPARATELETYRLLGSRSSKRSVYCTEGVVFFLPEYSKTRSLRQANRAIARFLSSEASLVLLNDVLIVRPFVCSLMNYLDCNQDQCYSTHVLVNKGAKMDAALLRNTFSRLFYLHSQVCISFKEYRHVAKYMANQLNISFV